MAETVFPSSSLPRVSVILPAYNGENYLAQSVGSVLGQTYRDWELIVVDDGSTDRTKEVAADFRMKDERILYVFQQNGGQGKARNTGIRMARGELIAFLDQDDLWTERKLELQIAAMDGSGVSVVFSDGFIFQGDDRMDETTTLSQWFSPVSGIFDGASMFPLLFTLNPIPMLTALVRKDAIERVGLLEEDRRYQNCDDYDLWLKLAESGHAFLGMSEKLVRYRVHTGQASKSHIPMLKAELAVLEKYRQSKLAEEKTKERRFQSLYRNLIESLVAENRIDEAQAILKELHLKRRPLPFTLFERALLKALPGQYGNIRRQLHRVRASFSYRIGKPLKSLYHRLAIPTPD